MGVMIKVGMADLKVCKAPDNLTTLGLGSCVGASIYDPVTKVSGMLHCMLPDSTKIANNQNRAKFADSGLDDLIADMKKLGAEQSRLVAKIAGGAQMFAFQNKSDLVRVGDRNVEASKTSSANFQNTGLNTALRSKSKRALLSTPKKPVLKRTLYLPN